MLSYSFFNCSLNFILLLRFYLFLLLFVFQKPITAREPAVRSFSIDDVGADPSPRRHSIDDILFTRFSPIRFNADYFVREDKKNLS